MIKSKKNKEYFWEQPDPLRCVFARIGGWKLSGNFDNMMGKIFNAF